MNLGLCISRDLVSRTSPLFWDNILLAVNFSPKNRKKISIDHCLGTERIVRDEIQFAIYVSLFVE